MRNERFFRKGATWALITALTLTLINVGSPEAGATSTKLTLTPAMVTNESGLGDATMIVDEQADAGDPRGGTGGTTLVDTKWHAGWGSGAIGASAYLDLGQEYALTDIYLRDANDSGNLVVSAGTPGSWTTLFTDPLTSYNAWKGHSVNVTTRYVRVTRAATTSNFYELVLYGSPATTDTQAPAASTLVAGSATTTSIPISWTAPGDDGTTGTATEYDVRYSTSIITTGNWSAASPVSGEPTPSIAGSSESYTLTGLTPNTTYYIAMKTRDEVPNESALSNVLTVGTLSTGGPPGQIILTPDMLLDERGIEGGKERLVDDQTATAPRTAEAYRWNAGNKAIYHPASVVIDLGTEYALTSINILDSNGSGPVEVSTGTPFAWTSQFTDPMTKFNLWSNHAVTTTTRYVRLAVQNNGPWIAEIVLYGSQVGPPPVTPVPVAPALPVMNDLVGINAFVDDPASVTQVAKFIREYHSWNWDEGDIWPFNPINTTSYPGYPNNQNKFAPSWAGGGGWNFDNYYGGLKASGTTVSPAIKESVAWLTAGSENKPLSAGENALMPASYIEHADHMYQYAARYGSTVVADGNLKLASGQARSTGLGYLDYFENWNEPDNTWDTLADYFKPYEFAAMSSADYDGHLGTLGSTVGVKNADPNAKMVMGGLSDPKLEYLRALKFWSDNNRGGSFPFDVINIHYYSHDGATQSEGTVGISPEADDMKGALSKIVEFRNKYYPDKEVWITEFGYDTDTASKQRVPTISGQTIYETQANWIIRSYLAAAAAGVDKAAMFMLRDVELAPGVTMSKFYASGLVGRKDQGYPKKDSWYYLYTYRNTLGEMYYLGEQQDSSNPNVMIYKFKSATSNAGAYVVWNKTSNNSQTNGYSLALQGNPTSASQVEMVDGDTDGVTSALTISGDKKVTVNVSEKPLFVLVNEIQ
ncbi:fibronectin type III domain-containing protein [Cohnella sp. GCM10027633]|uniref:fibronectin type III domain-containing protein n=1 Tax=unclassified Cohnella TaxID=2636738 RepID=UPI00362AF0FA